MVKRSFEDDRSDNEPPRTKRKLDIASNEKTEVLTSKPVGDHNKIDEVTNVPKAGTSLEPSKTEKVAKSDATKDPEVLKKKPNKCVTRNECVCDSGDEEPTKSQLLEDHEAHVLVAEWRLHKFQSPIELSHDDSISHDHFDPLMFHGHWDKLGAASIENNGKTVVIRFERNEMPYLVGGPLHGDTYVFEQLHFHWSEDDTGGCEHIFEGQAFSMEAHAVHYNKKYGSFEEAQDKPDGLAVVGFFLEATDNDDNPCFKKLTTAVQNITRVNATATVAPDCLTWIKEEAQCKGYYTYQGSLTTEPYLESVTWILYPTPIHVSRQQVAHFRELKSTPCEKKKIVNNVRPVQSPPSNRKLNIFYARSHRRSSD
ncbi:carbonic anhydrase 2 [Anthonomus grandis grandis]|uniref:carbonic anhydrase 2 n=1 Tax=Anthonomus grandis grandis TaxID=2921223 RepID=UPI0021668C14|nr:carbonic anhydrase 2 [Anthonomus grandis grandis]